MNGINLATASDIRIGSTQASAVYFGRTKLWPAQHDYSRDYFTIVNSYGGSNPIYFRTSNGSQLRTISVSQDNGTTWTQYSSSTGNGTLIASLNTGDKILIKGSNTNYSGNNASYYNYFYSNLPFDVEGNIMSLLYEDNFIGQTSFKVTQESTFGRLFIGSTVTNAENLILPATTLIQQCYMYMFFGCTSLTTAPELPATTLAQSCYSGTFNGCTSLTTAPELPATTLAKYCYSQMFLGCTSLTTAPELPATTIAQGCYSSMFNGCTSLTTAPELPATTLAQSCYTYMFNGCTSLTTAPELSATTLEQRCYSNMFNGCSLLNYIKCLATDISATDCTLNWVNNVAATGTFVKDPNMTSWTIGVNGIPTGWVTQHDYSQDYLTIVSLENNNEINFVDSSNAPRTIQVSTDNGSTWVSKTASSGTLLATLNTGDKLLLKGNNSSYASGLYGDSNYFRSSKTFNIEGNIMSLIYEDNFVGQTALDSSYTFTELFCGCAVVNAENLILPATRLANSCYASMFSGCTSLVTAPELPATTLRNWCYYQMFDGCTSLTTAPELPATTLAEYCYDQMFSMCTSLTTAPELPATTLTEACYYYMFFGCRNLNYIKCLSRNIRATDCTYYWVNTVAATGTFVKDPNMTSWTTGTSGIPSGWTIQNA